MRMGRSKVITSVIVIATVVLAGIASFSAYRLFGTKDIAVTPTAPKPSYAFNCEEYQLLVDTEGIVRIKNGGTNTQPTRDIDLIINGEVFGNFSVPALTPEEVAILGDINLPVGDFNWSIGGDVSCQGGEDGRTHETQTCSKVSFAVSAQEIPGTSPTPSITSSPTSTPTPTNTPSPTATSQPIGGTDPTSTPRLTATETQTPTKIAVITQAPSAEELLDAGVGYPTVLAIFFGILLIAGGLLLAL